MNLVACAALTITVLPFFVFAQDAGRAGRAPQPPLPFMIVKADPALDSLIAPGTKLDTIVTIPGLSGEGPMWRDGKLWFSDQRGGNIYTVTLDGRFIVIAKEAGGPIDPAVTVNQGPNGEVSGPKNTLIFARQGFRDIGRLNADGTVSSFISGYEGKKFNSPNDLVYGDDGTLWFTDPPFSTPGFVRNPSATQPATKELPFNGVFRYKEGRLTPVITDMFLPNGIGISPDGKTLYVDNTGPQAYIRAYDIAKDDALSNERMFHDFTQPEGSTLRGAADGLKVDSLGNVWCTGPGGIYVISPEGKQLGRIQLPSNATNIAFGDDLHSVFFTTGSTIYRLCATVAGLKPMYYRR